MSASSTHITFVPTQPDKRVEKYDVGMSLEMIIQQCVRELLNVDVEDHFVFEHGPDLVFSSNGATYKAEILNWKRHLKVIPARFRRILHNLKRASVKIIVCSFAEVFTKEQLQILRRKRVHILPIGFQVLPPDYFEKNTNCNCRIRKSSRRTFFLVKNRLLGLFSRITRLKSILYYKEKNEHTVKKESMSIHKSILSNSQNESTHNNNFCLVPTIRCLFPIFVPVVSLTRWSSLFGRLKRGIIDTLSEFREMDKVLLLFTLFHIILLRYALASDADLIKKSFACCTLLVLVLISATANDVLKTMHYP